MKQKDKSKNNPQNPNRRKFLKQAIGTTAGVFCLPYIIPGTALGKNGSTAASDRIVMGAIGVGSMGTGDLRGFLRKEEVQLTAVCDVEKLHRDRAKKLVDEKNQNSECGSYLDYRELLARTDLDTVLLALPDQWHGIISVACAKAGLDIHGQKPLARTIKEGRAIVKAVEDNNVIWQTGSWQRSVENFHKAAELVFNGKIGEIERVEVGLPNGNPAQGTNQIQAVPKSLDWNFWLGPAPKVPYRGVCHWDWRWIMDYSGGQLTDWAGHHIDIAHWGLGLDETGPVEVEGKGVYPRRGIYNVPVEYDIHSKYANGVKMRIANARKLPNGMGTAWYGSEGWIHVKRGGLKASDPKILEQELGSNDTPLYKSRDHLQNFLDCVKSRKETITPAQFAHRSISAGLLGEIAMLTGRKLNWDPDKEEFIGDEMANRLLFRPFRSPWSMEL